MLYLCDLKIYNTTKVVIIPMKLYTFKKVLQSKLIGKIKKMKIATIICEYNPLHNGHIYHIEQTRKLTNCDKLICIMSGNFVQRGEPACLDKFTRAELAVKHGVDMVIELFPKYALAPANIFASGAIRIVNCIKASSITLSFGTEHPNIDLLKECSALNSNLEINNLVQENMKHGLSYPIAFSNAVQNLRPRLAEIYNKPNNILAIEYLNAIKEQNANILPFAVERQGDYNSLDLHSFASASAIREAMKRNENLSDNYLPIEVMKKLESINLNEYERTLFAIMKYSLKDKAKNAYCLEEGLDNKAISSIEKSKTYDELINNIKSKRYTMARVKRGLLNALIDNYSTSKQLLNEQLEYVNILACASNSLDLLKIFNVKVVTSPSTLARQGIVDNITASSDKLYSTLHQFDNYMRIVEI